MKRYQAIDIQWDTDGVETDLPSEAVFELEDYQNPSLEGADSLSDKYGWCVLSFGFEEIKD